MSAPIAVGHLDAAEIHLAIDWAREEGWNPGLNDAQCFHAADSGGFLASLHDGEPAAVISLVRYSASYSFLGLYICRPDLRGRGYGMRAWAAAIDQAGTRTIGLDGVPAQQDNYARSGFRLAWRNTRYQTEGGGDDVPDLVDLDLVPFAEIARYDTDVFEANRQDFLRAWIAQPGARRLGVVRDGQLAGWGLLRRCAVGFKIGPLIADDGWIAQQLLDGLCAAAPGQPVFIDIPETNPEAIRLVDSRGMTPCFETARMYKGKHNRSTSAKCSASPRSSLARDRVPGPIGPGTRAVVDYSARPRSGPTLLRPAYEVESRSCAISPLRPLAISP